jgi:hypothetical protein
MQENSPKLWDQGPSLAWRCVGYLRRCSRLALDDANNLLPARDCSKNNEWLLAAGHGFGKRRVGRIVREVLLAGEKAQEGAALEAAVLADGAAQHGIALLDRVENGARGDWPLQFEFQVSRDAGEVAQVEREDNVDFAQFGFSRLKSWFVFRGS